MRNNMRTTARATLLALGVSFAAVQSASAQSPYQWATVGAACVPTDPALVNNLHLVVAGRVKFAPSKVGTITLICAVPPGVGQISRISAAYETPTGNASIKAELRRLRKSDGHTESVLNFGIAQTGPALQPFTYKSRAAYSYTLDDNTYLHFVQITLTRTTTSEIVAFAGADLRSF